MELTLTAPSYAFLATGVVDFFLAWACFHSFPHLSHRFLKAAQSEKTQLSYIELKVFRLKVE